MAVPDSVRTHLNTLTSPEICFLLVTMRLIFKCENGSVVHQRSVFSLIPVIFLRNLFNGLVLVCVVFWSLLFSQ